MNFIPSDQVQKISPYEAGKPLQELKRELQIDSAIKLASNENSFGFSPLVTRAVMDHLEEMNRYPESSAHDLGYALAEKYRVSFENIVPGNGSDDIIALLAHGFLNPGDEAIMPTPSFLMYEISVQTAKGVPIMVPLSGYSIDLDRMLDKISPKTKMILITNPFNPTGAVISHHDFMKFCTAVPENILIIVDEAYIEFVRDPEVYNSLKNPLIDPRIVTLRTFSKAYGLAGFRVGYGIMDRDVAQILHRIRQPFNVNALAQAAAVAALKDESFLEKSICLVHEGIDFFTREFDLMGFTCLPSQANFVMVDLAQNTTEVFRKMLEKGVIVRSMKSYGFPDFLRITVGTIDENKTCIRVLKDVLAKGNSQ